MIGKLRIAALLWLLSLSAVALAGWTDGAGKPLPDSDDRRSSGPLLAQLVLTADEPALRQQWEHSKATPQLSITHRVEIGRAISSAIFFQGCQPDSSGQCQLFVEFSLQGPDGKQMPAGNGMVWQKKPLAGRFMLGDTSISLVFDNSDQPGNYYLHANILDRVSTRRLLLRPQFELLPSTKAD